MKTSKLPNYLWAIAAIPFIYLAYRYPGLPAEIPTHYNLSGVADRWLPKVILWLVPTFFSLFMLIMMYAMGSMDTTGGLDRMGRKYVRYNLWTLVFTSGIACFIIYQVGSEQLFNYDIGLILMGGFVLIAGNYSPTVRPNEIMGFRTPWTLADEDNWRQTHRFGGKVWFTSGILLMLGGLLLPPDFDFPVLLVAMPLLVGIPFLYSYRLSQRQNNDRFVREK